MELSLPNSNKDVDTKSFLIECINKFPKDMGAYLHLADILSEEKNYDKALAILDKALSIFENDKNILEHKLGILLDSGRHDDARAIINELLKFEKVSAYAYNNHGFLLSIEGNYRESIESYKKALDIDRRDSSSMVNMAISYKAIYEYDKAIDMFEKANKINPLKSTKQLLDTLIKNKAESLFSYDTLVELLAKPDRFHLLIPKNFNAQIINNVLTIHSEDNGILMMISYNKNRYDNKKIEDEFNKYVKECQSLYSIVKPFSIVERVLYKDKLASTIFTSKINDSYIFNAFGLVAKNDEALIITISSNIFVSNKLIDLANTVINSLYFREVHI